MTSSCCSLPACQPLFVTTLWPPSLATGACTFYNELDVDDGYSFEEAMEEKTKRLRELEEAGAEQKQLDRVRDVLVRPFEHSHWLPQLPETGTMRSGSIEIYEAEIEPIQLYVM